MPDSASSGPSRLGRTIRASTAANARRALVVDDDESIRDGLTRLLAAQQFDVLAVDSAEAALEELAHDSFLLALFDVRMPGLSGVELVARALQQDPDLAILMLTAVNDAATATESLNQGAMDYLTKPVEAEALFQAIGKALRRRGNSIEQRKFEWLIREEVAARTEELYAERERVAATVVGVVSALVTAQEAKDPYLRGHSERVADLAAGIARMLGLSDDRVEEIRLAGRVMDIGLLGVRESVLHKPGALDAEEYDHVKAHVRIGVDILTPIGPFARIIPSVAHHHERFDGSGYPHGLRGEAISHGGRILAVADAFDALTSPRAWREPLSATDALTKLADTGDIHFDPKILVALHRVVTGRTSLAFLDPATE